MLTQHESVFAQFAKKAWPYHFDCALHFTSIAGGTPLNEKVAEGWLRSKIATSSDDLIRANIAQTMLELSLEDEDDAIKIVASDKHLCGFKVDPVNGLYIEGRQIKASLKEAGSVAMGSGKIKKQGWGNTKKGIISWMAEHVFIVEDHIFLSYPHLNEEPILNLQEPTRIVQQFIHKTDLKGRPVSAIQNNEVCEDVVVQFTVKTDHNFTDDEWAMIWCTGQEQGIGTSRSQGFGRYQVIKWEQVK